MEKHSKAFPPSLENRFCLRYGGTILCTAAPQDTALLKADVQQGTDQLLTPNRNLITAHMKDMLLPGIAVRDTASFQAGGGGA